MSSCLFIISLEKLEGLSIDELCSLRQECFKILVNDPDNSNRFECDRWAGTWENLTNIALILREREEIRFSNGSKS